jgi:DNA-binding NarL/FixJ family response regulator
VSKQRPSKTAARAKASDPSPDSLPTDLKAWRRRLFRNTYTRDGRTFVVRKWSVKIQHAGNRRTFTLHSADRRMAAVEARAIYQTICNQGWDAARSAPGASPSNRTRSALEEATGAVSKSAAAAGKARLLLRQHPSQFQTVPAGEYTTRIEHAGQSCYFPLGSEDAEVAARKAGEIYQTVVDEGWAVAAQRFRRELTLALHWSSNPLAWTYFTVDTLPPAALLELPSVPAHARPRLTVGLVESDPTLATVLAWCVGAHLGAECAITCPSTQEALRQLPRHRPTLVLVNQHLADAHGNECRERLRAQFPRLPVLTFAVHEDSDQLFKSTPGGAAGYLLKRTPPQLILDPISPLLSEGRVTDELIAAHVRRYFQGLAESLPAAGAADLTARLTHRELEVLGLLSKGYLDKEIADALRISTWTVHGHVKSIFAKLGVHTRTEAAVKYLHK